MLTKKKEIYVSVHKLSLFLTKKYKMAACGKSYDFTTAHTEMRVCAYKKFTCVRARENFVFHMSDGFHHDTVSTRIK